MWCNNKQVRNWLNGKWLSIPERWSRVRTAHDYQLNVFTSNGVEAQNKVLKYSFLKTRGLHVWCNNKQVRNWFNGKWLSIPERWSRVRTAHDYQLNVFTSNGVEAQNKVLKYSFLKTRGLHVWCNNKQVRNWLNGKWLSIPGRWSRVRTAHDYQLNVFTSNGVEAQNKVLKYSFLKTRGLHVWCNNKQVRNWLNGKWPSIPERWSRVRTAHDYQLNVFTSNGVEAQNKVLKYSFLKTRGLHVWCNNKQVRNWLNGKWLSIPERWSRVRTAHDYQLNVFTSNGVEAQNKVLKYSFLTTRGLHVWCNNKQVRNWLNSKWLSIPERWSRVRTAHDYQLNVESRHKTWS